MIGAGLGTERRTRAEIPESGGRWAALLQLQSSLSLCVNGSRSSVSAYAYAYASLFLSSFCLLLKRVPPLPNGLTSTRH